MSRRRLVLLLASMALGSCSSSSSDGGTGGPPTGQYLYVGDDNFGGALKVFQLPINDNSTPIATVPFNSSFTIGQSSTTLSVTSVTDTVSLFSLPITSASTPFAVFQGGGNGTPLFISDSVLYQGGSSAINVFTAPFSNTSVPARSIPTGTVSPNELAIDQSGNVYESAGGTGLNVISNGVLATTLVVPGASFRGLATTSTQLAACNVSAPGTVFIYNLPLTSTSTPAITLSGLGSPESCVFDASGNLYVGLLSQIPEILVFKPPFNAANSPTVTLRPGSAIFGMFIGK